MRLTSPRKAKLYTNILTFTLPILKGEVNPVDQMLIEGIRVFYPQLYTTVRNHPHMFLGSSGQFFHLHRDTSEIKQAINQSIGHLAPNTQQAALKLIKKLFPYIESVYSNSNPPCSDKADLAKAQKVASPEYFMRYFSYSVPDGIVPDQQMDRLIENVNSQKRYFEANRYTSSRIPW